MGLAAESVIPEDSFFQDPKTPRASTPPRMEPFNFGPSIFSAKRKLAERAPSEKENGVAILSIELQVPPRRACIMAQTTQARRYDHLYDPVYTASGQRDHWRAHQASMVCNVERVPDSNNLFSEILRNRSPRSVDKF